MKKLIKWFFILTLSPSATYAQGLVKGIIFDSETLDPLPFATVFLSNTTFGAVTDKEGKFSIGTVPPGEYEMIVSFMGYQTFQQLIEVKPGTPLQLELRVKPILVDLEEKLVEGKRDKSWYNNLKIFEEYFLGNSINAKKSKILNPKVLIMDDEQKPGYLIVTAKEPIVIENPNLGYQIRFVLESFECNPKNRRWSYFGYPYFEDLDVPIRRMRRIVKNRERAYFGSISHFLQAVYHNKLEEEGFAVFLVNRIKGEDEVYEDEVSNIQVLASDMALTDAEGHTFFHYRKPIFIIYNQEAEETAYSIQFKKMKNFFQTSKLILLTRNVRLEADGRYSPALSIYTEGYMAWERVADLMPFGYVPEGTTSFEKKSPEN